MKILKDINGVEVKASDINEIIINHFKKGCIGTLRTHNWSFWADVECASKRKNVYTFISNTYGHKFIVNFNDNTVMIAD